MDEMVCQYKDENYSVREDGTVLRHARPGKKPRPYDNQWMLGKKNLETGYMEIACVPVHRIVATAFHGPAPSKGHVVDHKDTNKRNNRPENLRWVTRLENIMLNPVTVKKIEWVISAPIEEFLADPGKYKDKFHEQNFGWMRVVTAEEGQRTLERLEAWAKSDKKPAGGTLGEWIYERTQLYEEVEVNLAVMLVQSKTAGAVQRNWKTVSEFPFCPVNGEGLVEYAKSLIAGNVFCSNESWTSTVQKAVLNENADSLFVITRSGSDIKPWALAKVTVEENLFVHESLGTFFEERGAERSLCEAQGLEWTGEDGIDDYC